jgi:hypothetical protein
VDVGLVSAIGIPTAGTVAFLVWTWLRNDARRTRRVLRRTRVSPIADLVDGKLACVVGTVELDAQQLTSMVARRSCVAYDTTVYFFKKENATIPERVEVERRLVPFYVVDDTGRVRIDAAEAALCNRPIARSERFEERIIEPGAKIRIVGSVVLEPVLSRGEHGYREAGTTATLTGTASWPLLIDVER